MTGLRELFQEAADSSSPPSRLVADEVYTAGRRWRRRRLTVASCATATVLATIAVAAVNLVSPPTDEPPIAGQTNPAPVVGPWKGQRIQWAGAADANHLYLAFSTCVHGRYPCTKWNVQVTGSADGGRTWSEPGTPVSGPGLGLAVLGTDTLIARPQTDQLTMPTTAITSTDGGRTWTATRSVEPVEAVPAEGTAICWPASTSCMVQVVDPVTHQIAPLTQQPSLNLHRDEPLITESAGRLWVGGTDPATGRPGVAVSADAGRTWSTHVFADMPPCSPPNCQPPALAVGDGTSMYAVATGERDQFVYRFSAHAGKEGWQRVTGSDDIPNKDGLRGSFVTADGAHVLYQLENGPGGGDVLRLWAARGGGTYRPVRLDGLPATAGPIRRTPDGWFYALGVDGVLYGSTDGWHWSPVTSR